MYFTFCSLLFAYLLFFKICEIKIKGKRGRMRSRGKEKNKEKGERKWGREEIGIEGEGERKWGLRRG